MRSILWIGQGEGLGCGVVSDAPELEISWARDIEDAIELPLPCFEAIVVDEPSTNRIVDTLQRLEKQPSVAPILVRIQPNQRGLSRKLLDAGANETVLRNEDESEWPSPESLSSRIEAMIRATSLRTSVSRSEKRQAPRDPNSPCPEIIGNSPAMNKVFHLIEHAQRSHATVLVTGETGTGKEAVARAIHRYGTRSQNPFVAVNCAAFSETLLESELFGHVRGAFTGADIDKAGLFEQASSGTLFLDEIAETSPAFQARLLRVLQEGEVRPVGSCETQRIDVRVIAATNRDLRTEVEKKRFREDLFYRISVFPVEVPALRNRIQDIGALASHFLERHGQREEKTGCVLAPETLHRLEGYGWPGNVRELENEMHRILTLIDSGETITPSVLSGRILGQLEFLEGNIPSDETLRQTVNRVEALIIRQTLHAQGGRRTATAQRLGLTREGLYKKMRRLGI